MAVDADTQARVILCAVDGSSADEPAIEVAAQLAELADARLALFAVAPVPIADAHDGALPTWTLDEAMRALERKAVALEGRIEVDCYLDAGNPVRRLVEFSGRTRPLLLVVGTRSRTTPSIVASGLMRAAPCPLVVVPEAAPGPELTAHRRQG